MELDTTTSTEDMNNQTKAPWEITDQEYMTEFYSHEWRCDEISIHVSYSFLTHGLSDDKKEYFETMLRVWNRSPRCFMFIAFFVALFFTDSVIIPAICGLVGYFVGSLMAPSKRSNIIDYILLVFVAIDSFLLGIIPMFAVIVVAVTTKKYFVILMYLLVMLVGSWIMRPALYADTRKTCSKSYNLPYTPDDINSLYLSYRIVKEYKDIGKGGMPSIYFRFIQGMLFDKKSGIREEDSSYAEYFISNTRKK